jgi:hypothetical protein
MGSNVVLLSKTQANDGTRALRYSENGPNLADRILTLWN